ncbi:MAG: hypothetical protein HYZ28_23795 [Myxococcales bacterium]|nr:hypothetical protein [Myxococcales bacterium]
MLSHLGSRHSTPARVEAATALRFAEWQTPEARAAGLSMLEGLAGKGRTKLAKAAKNKLALLGAA